MAKPTLATLDEQVKARYSDEELEEFRKIILQKKEKAEEDLALLTSSYTGEGGNSTEDTSPTFKTIEDGRKALEKEESSRLAARQAKFIRSLNNALIRIENKTYGICRITGKLISKERLRSVPHATLSMDGKRFEQQSQTQRKNYQSFRN